MSSLLRFTTTLLIAGSLVGACGSVAATVPPNPTDAPTPASTPAEAPTPAPTLAATSAPTELPNGWAMVVMNGRFGLDILNGGTPDPGTGRLNGISVEMTVDTMSDARANGTLKVAETAQTDSTGTLGYLWNTVTLENSGGSWAGTCRGIAWDAGNTTTMECWLTGRGGYAGLTYAYTATNVGTVMTEWTGLIYRGSPPAP
jgi:hypothetical protein